MRKSKQQSLFKEPRKNTKRWWIETQKNYGGSLNYRKIERPFDRKQLMHVVFKSSFAKGLHFRKSEKSISDLLKQSAKRYNLCLKEFSIQKDHIHVLVYSLRNQTHESALRAKSEFSSFLRFFACEMGRKYKKIYQALGVTKNSTKPLWIKRPFSRVVKWGKSLRTAQAYIRKNTLEALGFVEYVPRKHQLNHFLQNLSRQNRIASG